MGEIIKKNKTTHLHISAIIAILYNQHPE